MANVTPSSDGVVVELEDAEVAILRDLVAEVRELLGSGERDDPVVARLLPDAYDDADRARSYRELVGDDLTADKDAALRSVAHALGDGRGPATAVVTGDGVDEWLRALTELRLALGTRLDVDEDAMSADLRPDQPDAPAMAILHWLGWLQESMLDALRGTNGD